MEDLRKIVEKIAADSGFRNFELKFEHGSDLGFIGLLEKCRIIEDNRQLSVYCKFLPKDNEHNEKYNTFLLFEREVFIYKELFPEFEKLQREHGIETNDSIGFWSFPKCFYANFDKVNPDKSVIIMEDLTVENFEVKDKYIPSDFQHTSRLFVELAKLHSLSLALKLKKPEVFEKFKKLNNLMPFVMATDSMRDIAPTNCELICELFRDNHEVLAKLADLKPAIWESVSKTFEAATREPLAVICHGDVWINNVLYNYHDEDKRTIKDTKLVDWQMTFYGSLGSELTYYLYCCVDKATRHRHQAELLDIYYRTARSLLDKFSIEIFSFEELERQMSDYGLYAFGMANFALPLLCQYPMQLLADKNAALSAKEKQFKEDYEERMKHVILDMVDMKIL